MQVYSMASVAKSFVGACQGAKTSTSINNIAGSQLGIVTEKVVTSQSGHAKGWVYHKH